MDPATKASSKLNLKADKVGKGWIRKQLGCDPATGFPIARVQITLLVIYPKTSDLGRHRQAAEKKKKKNT